MWTTKGRRMNEWVHVAELSDLKRHRKLQLTAGDQTIALFLINDEVYALRDVCIHKGRSLSNGTVLHNRVICPGHQWSFDPATGAAENDQGCQPTYTVKVVDGSVYVDPRPRVLYNADAAFGSV